MPHDSGRVLAEPVRGASTGADRHRLVDALRGAALLGIVVVNVGFVVQHPNLGWARYDGAADTAVRWAITTLGELKVYPLFALLFGYGLSVQLGRAASSGTGLGARYHRRMLGLLVLGVAHAVLFFPGDILTIYAVVGTVAYLLRRVGSRRLLGIAAGVYAAASAVWLAAAVGMLWLGADLAEPVPADSLRVLTSGSFAEVAAAHLADWPGTLLVLAAIQGPAAFAFALAGIALGRTTVLAHPAAHRGRARRVLAVVAPIGLVVGGAAAALALAGGRYEALGLALGFAAAPAISAGYVATAVLVSGRVPATVSLLARSAGRMSLSVYLLESAVLSTLAYGYGLGLLGTLSPVAGTAVAVGTWAGLAVLAALWLRHARQGPAEWALRSLSCWRLQPLLDRAGSGPAGSRRPR